MNPSFSGSFRILVCIAGVLLWTSPSFADYESGLEMYLKEDYVRAASRFDRFVEGSPSDPRRDQALYYSAICRLKLDQPGLAVPLLRDLLDRAVSSPDGTPDAVSRPAPSTLRLALGTAYRRLGDETSALTYLESAWISSPSAYERSAAREELRKFRGASVRLASPPVQVLANADPMPSGRWVVQVVSTPDPAQAEDILSRLQSDEWPVFRETVQVDDTSYIRVRVGPYPSESAAHRSRFRIREKYDIEGWVTRK